MKLIALFGSTGSIGESTCKIIRQNPNEFHLEILVAGSDVEKLAAQALEFKPRYVCIANKDKKQQLQESLKNTNIQVLSGSEAINDLASYKVDLTVMAIVGAAAIIPTINALKAGNNIAMANKECLVCAGNLIIELAELHKVKIIPMDSEHTGLMQIFSQPHLIKDVTLTASGGPFRDYSLKQMQDVTKLQALKHPNWSMGSKISIDSATLVNKCLEVIEACHLFALKSDQVKILIHPESIIHALVNFQDGSSLAQISMTDMQIPISYALFYPQRAVLNQFNGFDLSQIGKLHFYQPDSLKFKSLQLLPFILEKIDSNLPLIFNMANEFAVNAFLNDQISFNQITEIIETAINKIPERRLSSLEDILNEIEAVKAFEQLTFLFKQS